MEGISELKAALTRLAAEGDTAAKQVVARGAAQIEAAAKGNFAGTHSKGEKHVEATVGGHAAPNVVSGTLRRSITHEPIKRYGVADFGTTVGPTAIYARAVELGKTPESAAYPYFIPAVKASEPKLAQIYETTWAEYLR